MEIETTLVGLERRFWTGDADFYRQNLADDAVMVLPDPAGTLGREEVVASLVAAPRWSEVEIAEPRLVPLGFGAAVLAYRATARREDLPAPYVASCGSVYVRRDGAWLLAFHQQTPSG